MDSIQTIEAIAVGASAGGPAALRAVLAALPPDLPLALLVVQHLPKGFSSPLSRRLAGACSLPVAEAEDGFEVEPGRVVLAPSGRHMVVRREQGQPIVRLVEQLELESVHRPAADALFASMAAVYGPRCLGLVLTGMGNDGTAGMRAIKGSGGTTWAQDSHTSKMYGMPKAAFEAGVVDRVLPLDAIGPAIAALALI
ncbi:MAG: chemotaxis protein CheB [Cyanobacteria bacterium REEB65]|nr:chemotaxis protein CheB [Cyanobacteria bacterium REEB65]